MINENAKPVRIKLDGRKIYYICPKCRKTIQFHKKAHGNSLCMRCGQRLDWSPVHDISSEIIKAADSDEVAWLAKIYYTACGMNEDDWITLDELRHSLRGDGAELYFLFLNKKAHGAFMRKISKEGIIYDG